MNKVDVAKWSSGDLSGCENLGRHRGVKGRSHAEMLDWEESAEQTRGRYGASHSL